MQQHPAQGTRILGNNPFYQEAREICSGHHEKYDGTGYPSGLLADAIPLSARIVKVADVFDALTTKRPYKEPWSMLDAITFIESESGSSFDPAIVVKLRELFDLGELEAIRQRVALEKD